MPDATITFTSTTRTNPFTGTSVTTKHAKVAIGGDVLAHEYVFGGAKTDADCKADMKVDLETGKGYGTITWV